MAEFWRQVRAVAGSAAALALGVLLLVQASNVLLLVFGGVLFAIFLRGISDWISQKTRLPARWALALVLLVLIGLLALGFWLGGVRLAAELGELGDRLPKAVQEARRQIGKYEWASQFLDRAPSVSDLMPRRRDVLSQVTGAVSSTLGVLTDAVVLLFLGLFFAIEPRPYLDGLVRLVPPMRRPRTKEVLGAIGETLRSWLLGKMLSMLLVGVLTALGLFLLGVPLALVMGVLAALLTFIPNLGPILSAVPAALLALGQGPMRLLYVLLLYLAIQTVESYVLTPLVQRRTISLLPGSP